MLPLHPRIIFKCHSRKFMNRENYAINVKNKNKVSTKILDGTIVKLNRKELNV